MWYVRYEGTGGISGPMSKEDALRLADRAGGVVFSPKFVTTEGVEKLLAELRNCNGLDTPLCESAVDLCQRAADTIILLSREKPETTPKEVDSLLAEMGSIGKFVPHVAAKLLKRSIDTITLLSRENPKPIDFSVGVLLAELQGLREAKEIIREGDDDAIGKMLKCVMDALISLSREKVVTGTIQGGELS